MGNEVMDNLNSQEPFAKSDSVTANRLLQSITANQHDIVLVGLHNYSRRPANNFGIDAPSVYLLQQLQQLPNAIIITCGNPYAISNVCSAPNLVSANEDTHDTQIAVYKWLTDSLTAKGTFPVSVCTNLPYGTGLQYNSWFPKTNPV
jgi:hypothetical protein